MWENRGYTFDTDEMRCFMRCQGCLARVRYDFEFTKATEERLYGQSIILQSNGGATLPNEMPLKHIGTKYTLVLRSVASRYEVQPTPTNPTEKRLAHAVGWIKDGRNWVRCDNQQNVPHTFKPERNREANLSTIKDYKSYRRNKREWKLKRSLYIYEVVPAAQKESPRRFPKAKRKVKPKRILSLKAKRYTRLERRRLEFSRIPAMTMMPVLCTFMLTLVLVLWFTFHRRRSVEN